PVDYSEPSNAIVPYVKDMLERFSGSLTLVHTYGPEALAYSELAITDVDLPEEARAAEEERLRTLALEIFPDNQVEPITKLEAAAMAKPYDAELSRVHAGEPPPAAIEIDFAAIKKELIDSADWKLADLKRSLGLDAHHSVLDGPVAESIRDEAVRRNADLIVLG